MTPIEMRIRAEGNANLAEGGVAGDRRSDPRIDLARQCKVYDVRGERYLAGMTWNVSRGGMCLQIDRPLDLRPGDSLFVGVATRRREAILCEQDMVAATVVRSTLTVDDRTMIALRLSRPAVSEMTPADIEPIAA